MPPVTSIRIEKLFGELNHEITFAPEGDGLTILHGANGVGKTTILKILNSLKHSTLDELATYPFSRLVVNFKDGRRLEVNRFVGEEVSMRINALSNSKETNHRNDTEKQKNSAQPLRSMMLGSAPTAEHFMKNSRSFISGTPWLLEFKKFGHSPQGKKKLSKNFIWSVSPRRDFENDIKERALLKMMMLNPDRSSRQFAENDFPDFYRKREEEELVYDEMFSDLNFHFIDTNRLHHLFSTIASNGLDRQSDEEPLKMFTISNFAHQYANMYSTAMRDYAEKSSALDSTYMFRVLDGTQEQSRLKVTPSHLKQLKARYKDVAREHRDLEKVGLLENSSKLDLNFEQLSNDPSLVVMVELYIKDMEEKFKVIQDLFIKTKMLKEILDNKFQNKRIVVGDKGLECVDSNNRSIKLENLSSGEQHQFLLVFDLLFNTHENDIVLLDEPEISMHIAWQKKFIDDALDIGRLKNISYVIATHSPQIVGSRWHSLVGLDNEEQKGE